MPDRSKLVLKFWGREKELAISKKKYRDFVNRISSILLKQDISKGDLTSNSLIKNNKNISAEIIAKEKGILAGLDEFKLLNKGLKITALKKDRDKIKKNSILLIINGPVKKILESERTSLNILQRMSGIAAATDKLAKKTGKKVKIASTRKTLWGYMDKKSVSIGGGLTHRLDLSDGIIIKENHIKASKDNIKKILTLSDKNKKTDFVEIEINNKKQAIAAANEIKRLKATKSKKLFAIMFDNMKTDDIKKIIDEIKNKKMHEFVLLEASGGINHSNIAKYAKTGVDVLSLGSITSNAKSLDMSMMIK